MRILLVIVLALFLSAPASAQYYYYDIIGNKKLNEEYTQMVSSDFKRVVLESFESDNTPSKDFFCEKRYSPDYSQSELVTKSDLAGESTLRTYFENRRVAKTINMTAHSVNTTTFLYDSDGRLSVVSSVTRGDDDTTSFSEDKRYAYDAGGKVLQLKISRNGKPVSTIQFVSDSAGNVIEENPVEGTGERKYYYYYDGQNRLTDVVHFNTNVQKLLPDFMFLYDGKGAVNQMISVEDNDRDYKVWRYAYTAGGLPEIQKCFSKDKKLLGTIQFEYFR